jgi:uncharacterized protein (TIRG00374 family)
MSVPEKFLGRKPHPHSSAWQRWGLGSWQLWIGILFSLGFIWLALRGVDLKKTTTVLNQVNMLILGMAVASYVFSAVAKSVRWRFLLSVRTPPSFGRVFSVLSIGVMLNAFLPARLGDLTRAYLMGESESNSKVYILGTIAVERVQDLLFLLLSLMVLLLQMALPEWLSGSARGMALVLAILAPCFILIVLKRDFILRLVENTSHFVPPVWREWLVRQARLGLDSLNVIHRPRLLIGSLGWSLLGWALSALTNYLVFLSLGLALPIWASLLILVVLQVGTAVPSSPGRIGVFQYLVILALSVFAVNKDVALGYSILLYLVTYIPIALIGAYYLWREKITWQKLNLVFAALNRQEDEAE